MRLGVLALALCCVPASGTPVPAPVSGHDESRSVFRVFDKNRRSVTMKTQSSAKPFGFIRLSITLLAAVVFGMLATASASAAQLTIIVKGVAPDGTISDITTDYRWTVE